MKKFVAFAILLSIVISGYTYRNNIKNYIAGLKENEKILREKELLLRELPPKKVEIFEIGKDGTNLEFTKTGTTSPNSTVYVSPQTTGKITNILVKTGDTVKKGDILVKLGDSLSTDIANQQYLSAKKSLESTIESLSLTKKINLKSLESAQLGVESAQNSLKNARDTRMFTNNLSAVQLDSAELALKLSKEAYEDLKDDYYDAKDTLEELEDKYNDLLERQPEATDALKELKTAISTTEAQISQLKGAKKKSKDAIEQTELGLEQTKKSLALQLDQLGFAIQATATQYESSINRLESLDLSTQLQELGTETQIIQADSAYQITKLNKEYQDVRSPIDGTVTAVTAEENNMTSPGQVLITIENLDKYTIKTSLNTNEAQFVKVGDKVKIKDEKGEITSISPTLNQLTKKTDVEIEMNKSPKIKPGAFVKITFTPKQKEKIFIPLNAVKLTSKGKYANVIDKNMVVEFRKVETGQILGDYIEITKGLKKNEKIIKVLTNHIEEGDKVALAN